RDALACSSWRHQIRRRKADLARTSVICPRWGQCGHGLLTRGGLEPIFGSTVHWRKVGDAANLQAFNNTNSLKSLRSLGDSNPCFRRERARLRLYSIVSAALAPACPRPRVWPARACVHRGRAAPHSCWARAVETPILSLGATSSGIACMIEGTPAITITLPIQKPGAPDTLLRMRSAPLGMRVRRRRASFISAPVVFTHSCRMASARGSVSIGTPNAFRHAIGGDVTVGRPDPA